jgi:hypothetical protein
MIPAVNAIVGSGGFLQSVLFRAAIQFLAPRQCKRDQAGPSRNQHAAFGQAAALKLGVFLCRNPAGQLDAEQFVEPSRSVDWSVSFQAEPAMPPVAAPFGHRRTPDLSPDCAPKRTSASAIHWVDDEIIGWLQRREQASAPAL